MTAATEITDEQADALKHARNLIEHGVPVFIAEPAMRNGHWDPAGGHDGTGYWMPKGWQKTVPDVAVLDRWRPGKALCAVMGHGVDLLDVDPRNGGDVTKAGLQDAAMWPRSYGTATTPSGGTHDFMASLGVPSSNGIAKGLDVKAGHDGDGHGFAFLAPTVKLSKVTGEAAEYRWTAPPNLDGIDEGEDTGAGIAAMITGTGDTSTPFKTVKAPFELPDRILAGDREQVFYDYACSLRGKGVKVSQAMRLVEQAWRERVDQSGHPFTLKEALSKIDGAWGSYDGPGEKTAGSEAQGDGGGKPAVVNLADFLAQPDPPVTFRIHLVMTSGGRVMLAAQYKAGKTTLVGNLIRSLVDGDKFLDTYPVQQARRVVLIDDELDPAMLRRWLRAHGIVNTERVDLISLKGSVSTFNMLTADGRAEWAAHIGPADVLILDCLRPVLDGMGLSEDKDAGRFLVHFDEMLKLAGIAESVTVHHMGHNGERSRGDSRLLDWPDQNWKLTYTKDRDGAENHSAPRYFAAYGRDVDQPECQLSYDDVTKRLAVVGGTRQDVAATGVLLDVLDWLAGQTEGVSGRVIDTAFQDTGHTQRAVRDAVKKGVRDLDILVEDGPKRARLHSLNPSSALVRGSALPVRQRTEEVSALVRERFKSSRTHTHASTGVDTQQDRVSALPNELPPEADRPPSASPGELPLEVDRCPICRSRTRPSSTGQPSVCKRCTAAEVERGGPA